MTSPMSKRGAVVASSPERLSRGVRAWAWKWPSGFLAIGNMRGTKTLLMKEYSMIGGQAVQVEIREVKPRATKRGKGRKK